MKKGLMLLFLILPFCSYGQSKEKSFSAKVNKSTFLFGNVVKVEFELKNIQGNFEPPAFSDFDIVSGPNTSSSMMMANGETSSTKKYSYYLKAKKEGKLFIESAFVSEEDDKNNNMETKPITINVKANPTGIIEEEEEEDFGSHFFSFPDIRTDGDFLRQQWGGNLPAPEVPEKPKPKRKVKRI